MRIRLRMPRFGGSTLTAGPNPSSPVLDGRDVVVPNRWKVPADTVVLLGRPAASLEIHFAGLHWEPDFGGHLFVGITGADASHITIVEGGPMNPNGTGALVPFCYPEDALAERGMADFPPIVIPPPHGLTEAAFADLVRSSQRAYDGDQRYVAIEMSFLRVGRDSNSYAVGVLLCSGIDLRSVPSPHDTDRYEWTGYPGMEDPVPRANFGVYMGSPTRLTDGAHEVAFHNADGSVRFVVVGGEPNGSARLPDGEMVTLDALGRSVFSTEDAARHGLPTARTDPPRHIVQRRHFPHDPAPAGALLSLLIDGRAEPLEPGKVYRGTVVDRHDALRCATIRSSAGEVVLPIDELGFEMRDPKRVDTLFHVGNELSVGLHRDRHPRLVAHEATFFEDRLRWRRFHAPRAVNIATTVGLLALLGTLVVFWRRRSG